MTVMDPRIRGQQRLEAYLRAHHVPYLWQHHPQAFTAQQVAEAEQISSKLVAKVVVVFAGGEPLMLVLPANRRVDLEEVAAVVERRPVRLAEEHELKRLFPDCELGAMPPFGNLYGLPVLVDGALARDEEIVFQAGTHMDTLRLRYDDFARLVVPTIAYFTRRA